MNISACGDFKVPALEALPRVCAAYIEVLRTLNREMRLYKMLVAVHALSDV